MAFESNLENTGSTLPIGASVGFGSYLNGILPADIALACGALRVSMLQIQNIRKIPVEKFAQVVTNLEMIKDLQVNGTRVPTNSELAAYTASTIGKGSGVGNTYTMSDFFGSISGLPYNNLLIELQKILHDDILENIYHELYLATTWRGASLSVTTNNTAVPDGFGGYNYYYQITGINVVDAGGGYSRGTAAAPIVTISGGSGASAVISNWAITVDSSTVSTFGRINGINVTNFGGNTLYGNGASAIPPPTGITATIEAPPITNPGPIGPILPVGYVNSPFGTVGWPNMNVVVQNYIDQANARIIVWSNSNSVLASAVNTAWNAIGRQLLVEQRARQSALYPLTSPKDPKQYISQTPVTEIAFVNALRNFSKQTQPHQHAQTLEAISNWTTIGGQSIVASMRQERNATKLRKIGIDLNNNIATSDQTINRKYDKNLISNDTTAGLYIGPTTLNAPDVVDTSTVLPTQNNQAIGQYNIDTNTYNITDINYHISALDSGNSGIPGSFAGSQYVDLIEPELNVALISAQVSPITYTADEAIAEIENCNCECWDKT